MTQTTRELQCGCAVIIREHDATISDHDLLTYWVYVVSVGPSMCHIWIRACPRMQEIGEWEEDDDWEWRGGDDAVAEHYLAGV